jgi:hypothetical protein
LIWRERETRATAFWNLLHNVQKVSNPPWLRGGQMSIHCLNVLSTDAKTNRVCWWSKDVAFALPEMWVCRVYTINARELCFAINLHNRMDEDTLEEETTKAFPVLSIRK